MVIIAPSVLAENEEEYQAQMQRIAPFAERVHIDVSDGEFTLHATAPLHQVWWPETMKADIHMMVRRPEEHIEWLLKLRPNLVIFHAEADGDVLSALRTLRAEGIRAGVALQRRTVPSSVEELIKESDHVMIFSGKLGEFGGEVNYMQLEKIRLIQKINGHAEIGWDGGINLQNIYNLVHGGVQVAVVGKIIHSSEDPDETYQRLILEAARRSSI